MIATQLRTAKRMLKRITTINRRIEFQLLIKTFRHFARRAIYAPDSRNNPNFVTNPDVAIFSAIPIKCQVLQIRIVRFRHLNQFRFCIKLTRQRSFQIMLMNPFTNCDFRFSDADSKSVFNNLIAFFKRREREFMTSRNIVLKSYFFTFNRNNIATFQLSYRDGDIITVINFKRSDIHQISSIIAARLPTLKIALKFAVTTSAKPFKSFKSSPQKSAQFKTAQT